VALHRAGEPPACSLNRLASEVKAAVVASGETPLEYMLRIMRDGAAESTRRDDMAKAAAPYLLCTQGFQVSRHRENDAWLSVKNILDERRSQFSCPATRPFWRGAAVGRAQLVHAAWQCVFDFVRPLRGTALQARPQWHRQ
jgi:hypothetical protein